MSVAPFCGNGNSTRVFQEKFFIRCEFPNFEIDEGYEEIGEGLASRVVRKVRIGERMSDRCLIGQSINFPSYWCITVRNSGLHAGVGLMFHSTIKNGSFSRTSEYAFCKFRINIVDKDGDLLFEKQWQSWEAAKKIHLGKDYIMPDFIALQDLFENRMLFLSENILHLNCEGVLYSDFHQVPLIIGNLSDQPTVSPLSLRLWNSKMEFSDLELISNDGEVAQAHKSILCGVGPLWRSRLRVVSNDAEAGEVTKLELDLTRPELLKMLQFIYTGKFSQDWNKFDEVEGLLLMAKEYELPALRRLCVDKIGDALTLSSFTQTAMTFQAHFQDSNFIPVLNRFLTANMDKLTQQESFQNFAKENKSTFLDVVLFAGGQAH